jgi:hypothetical protein
VKDASVLMVFRDGIIRPLRTRTDVVLETMVSSPFNLSDARLVARETVTALRRHESFRSCSRDCFMCQVRDSFVFSL